MKRFLLPIVLLAAVSCKKSNNDTLVLGKPLSLDVSALKGEWKLHSSYASPGDARVEWKLATETVLVSFSADGVYSNNKVSQFDHYLLSSYHLNAPQATDTLLKLYKQGGTDTLNYVIRIYDNALVLNNTRCIEGCGEKYVKVQ